jgi:predicted ArsR family transcriptional regulator
MPFVAKARKSAYVIKSLAQLRGLASPVRQEIVDAVSGMRPASIATLARALGRAPNALYFHIAKLESLGLLVRRGGSGPRGRPFAVYDVPGRPMAVIYQPDQSKTKPPIVKLVRAMVSSAARTFTRSYRPDVAVVAGAERNLWASRSKQWLSPRELREVNGHLHALVTLLNRADYERRKGDQLIELTFVLAPVSVADDE